MKGDTYKEAMVIEFPGMVARIHRPILTEEEHKRRMQKIHDSAASLLLSIERKN